MSAPLYMVCPPASDNRQVIVIPLADINGLGKRFPDQDFGGDLHALLQCHLLRAHQIRLAHSFETPIDDVVVQLFLLFELEYFAGLIR